MNKDCRIVDHNECHITHGCWMDGVFHAGLLGSTTYLLGQGFSMRDARQFLDALPYFTGLKDGTEYPLS